MKPHPDALQRAHEAVIPDAKISSYVLDPGHDIGGHKARMFSSVLGITIENRHLLEDAIYRGLPNVQAISRGMDQHGEKFQADIKVTGPKGSAIVRTGWIVREPGGVPHLTTARVLKGRP